MTEDRKHLIVACTLFALYVVCDVVLWWLDRRDKRAARVAENRAHIERTEHGQVARISDLPVARVSNMSASDDVIVFEDGDNFTVKQHCTVADLLQVAWREMPHAQRKGFVDWHNDVAHAQNLERLRATEAHLSNGEPVTNIGGYGGTGRETPDYLRKPFEDLTQEELLGLAVHDDAADGAK